MKAIMMNELESALVEWVSKNDKHDRAYIHDAFINKGYPYNEIESAFSNLLRDGTLQLEGDCIVFTWPAGGTMKKDDFSSQGLLNNNTEKIWDVPVPDYIKAAMAGTEEVIEAFSPKKNPAVHSPKHYTRGGIETIDFIEAKGLNFHLGNVVKYVSRAGYKQDALIQDLEKSLWYLNREINRLKKQEV